MRHSLLLPDWKWVIKKAWSVRVLAVLAVVDFIAAAAILFVDGAAERVLESHVLAVVVALAVKSALSVFGIYLRVRVQKEAEEIVEAES